jgi:hypothetical protein
MRHPWSVPILLALAALAGYAAGARPVQAQADAFPFQVSDIVTFSSHERTYHCRIEEMRGNFARCGSVSEGGGGFSIGRPERPDEWVNVAVAQSIIKHKPRK